MIIAVDYDGTLFAHEKPNLQLISRIRHEQLRGSTVILWTCREGKTLSEALRTLRSCGFVPNYVNCNCPEAIRYLGHDTRKILADVYIDDKNARFDEVRSVRGNQELVRTDGMGGKVFGCSH